MSVTGLNDQGLRIMTNYVFIYWDIFGNEKYHKIKFWS